MQCIPLAIAIHTEVLKINMHIFRCLFDLIASLCFAVPELVPYAETGGTDEEKAKDVVDMQTEQQTHTQSTDIMASTPY